MPITLILNILFKLWLCYIQVIIHTFLTIREGTFVSQTVQNIFKCFLLRVILTSPIGHDNWLSNHGTFHLQVSGF